MEVIAIAERADCWRWEIRHNGRTIRESNDCFRTLAEAIEDGKHRLLDLWTNEDRPPIVRRPWRRAS